MDNVYLYQNQLDEMFNSKLYSKLTFNLHLKSIVFANLLSLFFPVSPNTHSSPIPLHFFSCFSFPVSAMFILPQNVLWRHTSYFYNTNICLLPIRVDPASAVRLPVRPILNLVCRALAVSCKSIVSSQRHVRWRGCKCISINKYNRSRLPFCLSKNGHIPLIFFFFNCKCSYTCR